MAALYAAEAEAYRDLWAPVLHPVALELVATLPRATRVLDLGCGVGTLLRALRDRTGAGLVVGVDASHGMIALADTGFARVVGDILLLPFADVSVDVAVAAFVLFHLSRPPDGLAEMRRVLRPGGTAGTVTWCNDSGCPALEAWTRELDRHGARPDDTHSWHESVNSTENVAAWLEEAGFNDVRTWNAVRHEQITADEFVERRVRLGTSRRRLATLDPETREACIEAAAERVRGMDPSAFWSERRFVLATARAPGGE